MSGLFSTFNIAKSGLTVSQQTIDVTSHNISNSGTTGYSRQVARVETSRPATTITAGQVGTGAQVSAIQRIRDSFLDYQVRNENSTLGKYDIKNSFLKEVESIFNEPSDTGISTLMTKFFASWQELSKQPQSSNARTVVAQQTQALTDALNHTYTKLTELQTNAQNLIKNSVTDVNSILNQLDQLNKEIMSVEVAGNTPNDLMDKRDLLLDQLSSKFNITVDKKQFEGLDVKPVDQGSMKYGQLVAADKNSDVSRFSYISDIQKDLTDASGQTYVITYYKLGDTSSELNKGTLKVTGLTEDKLNELKANRVLWSNTEGVPVKGDGYPTNSREVIQIDELMDFKPSSGELSGIMSVQKDINEYIDQLNKVAKSIAFSVNAIHSGLPKSSNNGGYPDKDYTPFFVNKDVAKYKSNGELNNLDVTLEAESEINAGNITINTEILKDVMKIKTRPNDNSYAYANENIIDGEGKGDRALAIAELQNTLLRVQDFGENINSREDMFNPARGGATLTNNGMKISSDTSGMKLDAYFKDMIDKLGVQSQEAERMVTNQDSLLASLEQSRDSVSGVSLDEEMANLVQFQHSYNANAKIISTVDELLDVIINGLKR